MVNNTDALILVAIFTVPGSKEPLRKFIMGISTNEKPGFLAIDQSEASISSRFLVLAKSGIAFMSLTSDQ